MFDLVLKNAKIIDGTGNPFFKADIAIEKGKIVGIGLVDDKLASQCIDVQGYTVCPGFIDYHGHSDVDIFAHGSVWNKLEQGITTEVAGHCGITIAPIPSEAYDLFIRGAAFVFNDEETKIKCKDFTTFGKYLDAIERTKIGINLAVYVGHCTIRGAVMGFADRPATDKELSRMKSMVREAMEAGALGLSTGLIYPPGMYADTDELVALCKVVAEYGGSYASHIRSESFGTLEATKEAIDIGRRAQVPIILSHTKIAAKELWGTAGEKIKLIQSAVEEGIDVGLDQYPYIAGATALRQSIPPKYQSKGIDGMLEMLKDVQTREQIKNDILTDKLTWENFYNNCGPEGIRIIQAKKCPEAEGKTLKKYANEHKISPLDALFDILLKDDANSHAAYFMMCEQDVETIMRYPHTMMGTDGSVIKEGVASLPRYIGTCPRILGRYVRQKGVLTLEDAVRKMTSLPANKARLKTKGLVKEGYDADIVVFDASTIMDQADFNDHTKKNKGIKYVFVNGELSVEDNHYNGALNGKLLRKRLRINA